MRRGLMHWSHAELPPAVLAQRVQRLQQAMRDQGLAAVVAYTSFAQPAVVHWLTNFTPYWSEALLVVPAQGPTVLLAALTPRVHTWILSMSQIGSVLAAPRLGDALVRWLAEAVPDAGARIGIVGRDALPWPVARPLLEARGEAALVDAGALYRGLRQPVDAHERALAQRALAIGDAAWAALDPELRDSAQLAARIESVVRLAGAEELLMRVAPNLEHSAVGLRLETALPLAARYAVEMSLAYKGSWIRLGRSFVRAGATEPASWAAAERWFDGLLGGAWRGDTDPPALARGLDLEHWQLDASVDAWPLAPVAQGPGGDCTHLPDGGLAVLSARIAAPDGHWFRAAPLLLHAHGTQPLTVP